MFKIIKEALSFDDVLLVPNYSKILPCMVNLSTKITKNIVLNIPIISAALDYVTEAKLAIALAQEGGIGFIHKNMSINQQVKEVKKVKNFINEEITNPQTVGPTTTLQEVKALTERTGFTEYPVINMNNELIGIITNRDIVFIKDLNLLVSEVMTPKDKLLIVKPNESRESVIQKMHDKRLEKALVVDDAFHLIGMITVKDFYKLEKKPNSCKDSQGRLRVGAAVAVHNNQERIPALIDAGIDILLIDYCHGHSEYVLQSIRHIRRKYPNLEIIGGTVATRDGALALRDAGVNAVKVGSVPGYTGNNRTVNGVGVPQITAITDVVAALADTGIPVIASGGMKFAADITKAIAAGASCVMVDSLLAGTEESPGDIHRYQGRLFKYYRGINNLSKMQSGLSERYFQFIEHNMDKLIPEVIKLPYTGSLKEVLHPQIVELRCSMELTGCATIDDLRTKAEFVLVNNSRRY